jgi:predicted TIM-barrel fold metal-dependent hydrolase
MVSAQQLLAAMDDNGVDKSVVFGFPWHNPELFKMHNDCIIEAVQRHPDRLIGLGCFDPGSSEAPQEAERCLAGGLAGIGELAFYRSGIDEDALDRLAPVMDICRDRGRPVLIHTNEPVGHAYPGKTPNTLAQIYRMVKRFPANSIVLAHWGGGLFFFNLLKKEVKDRLNNVYFDTAASPFNSPGRRKFSSEAITRCSPRSGILKSWTRRISPMQNANRSAASTPPAS